jgi:hypothetical protein
VIQGNTNPNVGARLIKTRTAQPPNTNQPTPAVQLSATPRTPEEARKTFDELFRKL